MIGGSSALQNVFVDPTKEPSLRVTLKSNMFIGDDQLLTGIKNTYEKDLITGLFNSKYIVWAHEIDFTQGTTTSDIYSYDSGGSMVADVSLTGASGFYLEKGVFQNTGNTYNLIYIEDASSAYRVRRLSTSDAITWSGNTILSTQSVSFDAPVNFVHDIVLTGSTEGYLLDSPLMNGTGYHSRIAYFNLGMSSTTVYTDKTDQTIQDSGGVDTAARTITGFSNGRYNRIFYQTGKRSLFPLTTFSAINTLTVGNSLFFEKRQICHNGSSLEGFRLIKGGLGASYFYFGIDRYYANGTLVGTSFVYSNIASELSLFKVSMDGKIFQRYVFTGVTQTAGIIMSGITSGSIPTETLSILLHNGSSQLIRRPIYDYLGSSLDLSLDIITYDNQNNERITLEIGNSK